MHIMTPSPNSARPRADAIVRVMNGSVSPTSLSTGQWPSCTWRVFEVVAGQESELDERGNVPEFPIRNAKIDTRRRLSQRRQPRSRSEVVRALASEWNWDCQPASLATQCLLLLAYLDDWAAHALVSKRGEVTGELTRGVLQCFSPFTLQQAINRAGKFESV
ncbi:hypothetical protein GQ53DRAFT_409546 [Thozetella sp. PMI_491]|nr:hypothetical protein GQ53DRAFT_409546 [Thozetella sp. PMI_491]